jgi:phosphatidylserine/phosphatidylglycerophosphate/cardiolipin synthase-like enzyme
MSKVRLRPYCSPTLVLLALDWGDGKGRDDFLGFAIKRSPGFGGAKESWLTNRIGFDGPAPDGGFLPSNTSPIQKFEWWDAQFGPEDAGTTYTYTATPVLGTPDKLQLDDASAGTAQVTIPHAVENGIGTYFNRAVVSSQAFMREFGAKPAADKLDKALEWLGNGMPEAVQQFIADAPALQGAIYHLTDDEWLIPTLGKRKSHTTELVYDHTAADTANDKTVAALHNVTFDERTKAHIMHDKILVAFDKNGGTPQQLLMGSANFTTEGLTTQANLVHTFSGNGADKLAGLYAERVQALQGDPSLAALAKQSGWSDPISVGDATIRAFFPPEPKTARDSIDVIVDAVNKATSSVLFCAFDMTDTALLDAIFAAGDRGLMMFGLVNHIEDTDGKAKATQDKVEIYHRSRQNRDVVSHDIFARGSAPSGFWWEAATLPGNGANQFPVFIHHKFVIIDAETDSPAIYSGSANMSNSSMHSNDENILEITNCPRLAHIYLAEFLRLYEHYRARAAWNKRSHGNTDTFQLSATASWATKAFTDGTPECKSRIAMAGGA